MFRVGVCVCVCALIASNQGGGGVCVCACVHACTCMVVKVGVAVQEGTRALRRGFWLGPTPPSFPRGFRARLQQIVLKVVWSGWGWPESPGDSSSGSRRESEILEGDISSEPWISPGKTWMGPCVLWAVSGMALRETMEAMAAIFSDLA